RASNTAESCSDAADQRRKLCRTDRSGSAARWPMSSSGTTGAPHRRKGRMLWRSRAGTCAGRDARACALPVARCKAGVGPSIPRGSEAWPAGCVLRRAWSWLRFFLNLLDELLQLLMDLGHALHVQIGWFSARLKDVHDAREQVLFPEEVRLPHFAPLNIGSVLEHEQFEGLPSSFDDLPAIGALPCQGVGNFSGHFSFCHIILSPDSVGFF